MACEGVSELQKCPLDYYANQNYRAVSPCRHEGRCASSRNVARVAMGRLLRQVLAPGETQRRTVKSCGPGAATLASIPVCLCGPGNGGKRGRSPGRARSKPPNHCAGKAGMSGRYLSNPCASSTTHCTRCLRVPPAPGLPCALYPKRTQRNSKTRAKTSRGNAFCCLKARSTWKPPVVSRLRSALE